MLLSEHQPTYGATIPREAVWRALRAEPWAITVDWASAVTSMLQAGGPDLTAGDIPSGLLAARPPREQSGARGVAVLPIHGHIQQRADIFMSFFGGTSTEQFTREFRQAVASDDVAAIVLDIDSPGGTVAGVAELAAEIFAARGVKPIVAVANGLMASAAFWIGAAAGEIVATPSARVGSIGVFAVHVDNSEALEQRGLKVSLISAGKFKTDGNPFEPLSDSAREELQTSVDEVFDRFTRSVASSRDESVAAVRGERFGEGRLLTASDALRNGVVDRIATLDEVLRDLGVVAAQTQRTRALSDDEIAAVTERVWTRIEARLDEPRVNAATDDDQTTDPLAEVDVEQLVAAIEDRLTAVQ